jgi:non-ribosomal peptide synthase protein (TIGR01720 family)
MQLLAKCRAENIHLALNQVLRAKSIAHLARSIEPPPTVEYANEQTDKPFALSPIQQLYFQIDGNEGGSQFNQSFTTRLSRNIASETLKHAFDIIVKHHSMLRARFIEVEARVWQQVIPATATNSYAFKTHAVTASTEAAGVISATQKGLNIQHGPVFAVDNINMQSGEQILFIAAHHLVVDVVSWTIILGDLKDILSSRSAHTLPQELSFQTWCEKQMLHASQPLSQDLMQKQSFFVQPSDNAFWGMDNRPNVYGDVERDEFTMNANISTLALDTNGALRTSVVDLLVAAILHSFSRVFIRRKPPTIFSEGHGREPWGGSNIDITRTVGWFTTMYPITVPIGEDEDEVVHTVRQVKDLRRRIVENGRPYFAHRFLTEDGQQRFMDHAPMEVLFNYLGTTQQNDAGDSLFQAVHFSDDDEELTSDVGAKTSRLALFEITASVVDGKIQMSFMYNRWMKNQKGIRRWMSECQRTLEEMATTIAAIKTPQPTISDFPLLPLESYERLDRVLRTLPAIGITTYDQVEDMYPCSAIQEGMLLSQIKDPESYWSFTTFEVKSKFGPVDKNKLTTAWRMVVDRHPALRTVIVDSVCKGGVFDQVVIKNPDTGLVTYMCAGKDLNAKLASIKYPGLNGKKTPRLPHQAAIVQTSSGKVIVKVIVNHAVVDGGSLAIIGSDLEDAYEGRLSDGEGPLYSDYIKYLRGLDASVAISYWKKQLSGVRPCYFPPMPQQIGKQRQLHSLDMKFHRFAELHAFAESNNVTLSNILLAAWAMILRSYTDTSDVCYGYLTSGRNVPVDGVEYAVGAFINMLVSRIPIVPSGSLLDVIRRVQDEFIESVPHQHCSLAQFQHDLGLGSKALFNTAVSIQNSGASHGIARPAANIEFEQIDGHDASEYVITLNIDATRGDEAVRFAYWTDSVSDGEAKNVSLLMTKILTQVLINSSQTLAELDVAVTELPSPMNRTPFASTPARSPPASPPTLSPIFAPRMRPRTMSSRSSSSLQIPKIQTPRMTSSAPAETPDWSVLIRSIVAEMVPQIVDQMTAKNKAVPEPGPATIAEMTNQMTGLLARRASISQRERPNMETASLYSRGRRNSMTSNAGSRIQTAADMVAAAGVLATEALQSPDFVEKKLLGLWSELLDMVEDTIEKDDSFFVSHFVACRLPFILTLHRTLEAIALLRCDWLELHGKRVCP